MKKLGSGSRATFVSPYLRRPLRSLNKVLGEREGEGEPPAERQAANDGDAGPKRPAWLTHRKPMAVSD